MDATTIGKLATALNSINSGIQTVTSRVANIDTRLSTLEQRARLGSSAYSLPGCNEGKDKGRFSFGRAFLAIKTNDWRHAQYEKEIFDEMGKRAMSTGTGSAGYLVPAEQMEEVIQLLTAKTAVIAMGATVLDDLTGSPATWPRQTAAAVAYWVGENAAITASDLTVGQLSLTPKKVAALVKSSRDLTILSNPKAEGIIRRDLARGLALAIDLAALRGSGSSNQPLGIANSSGIGTFALGTNGGSFDFLSASSLEGVLDDANALQGRTGFIYHPKIKRLLKRMRIPQFSGDTGGMFVVPPVISDQALADYLGHRFATTTQIPVNLTKGSSSDCSEVYFGNWEELFVGMWAGLEIMSSDVAGDASGGAFSSDQLWIRAIQRIDIGLRHAASFALCSDARVLGA